ncbi:hypothetical protein [Paenibacillus illinoisensis]|uniref:hypothetical protein n=1 Tax=Paenibacillus illinoisensis TaxID=59845 RepID=UPI00301CA45F
MKKSLIFLCLAAICLLSACSEENRSASGPGPTETAPIDNGASGPRDSDQLPLNLDDLGQYRILTGSGKNYTEADLERLAEDKRQRDYAAVIQHFVQHDLNRKIRFLDSVDGTYNPREVVVGTTDGNVYKLSLRKRYDYNGIWTVHQYAQFIDEGAVPPNRTVQYEWVDDLSGLPESARKQIHERIASKTEERGYVNDNGTIYVLLVAPHGHSVELLNVFGNGDIIEVQYATAETPTSSDGKTTTPMFGENPHVVIKVKQPITDISFKKYAGVTNDLIRLNLP